MADKGVRRIDFDTYLEGLAKTKVLLLTCMDYRYFELIVEVMKKHGLERRYDQVILAGAALGAVVGGKEQWHQTFIDHLGLAEQLHDIKAVIVLEHRDCGAYGPKGFGLLPDNPNPEVEQRVHYEQVAKLQAKIPRHLSFRAELLKKLPKKDALAFDQLI